MNRPSQYAVPVVATAESPKRGSIPVSRPLVGGYVDARPVQILNGQKEGTVTGEYGGEAVDSLRGFVRAGGNLVTFNNASNFAIEQLNLPVNEHPRLDSRLTGVLETGQFHLQDRPTAEKNCSFFRRAWPICGMFERSPAFEMRKTDPLVAALGTSQSCA